MFTFTQYIITHNSILFNFKKTIKKSAFQTDEYKGNKFDASSEGITYVGVTPITSNDTAMDTISIGTRTALSI